MGEQNTNHWGMRIDAEGEYIQGSISTAAGEFRYIGRESTDVAPIHFDVEVTDGELNLAFQVNASRPWVANHLKLTKIGNEIVVPANTNCYRYDLGPIGSETEEEWTTLTPGDFGDVYWTGGSLIAEDQGGGATITNLTRDFIASNELVQLNHKIANGKWRIELVMGEKNSNHWGMRIDAEGESINTNVSTGVGEFKYIGKGISSVDPIHFDVDVTDEELNIIFKVNASRRWVANHLKMTRLTVDSDGDGTVDDIDPNVCDCVLGDTCDDNDLCTINDV